MYAEVCAIKFCRVCGMTLNDVEDAYQKSVSLKSLYTLTLYSVYFCIEILQKHQGRIINRQYSVKRQKQ